MPPAFVLSQDQTLRKYLRSAFSKLFCSLKNCSVALFLKHWIYFAWLFNFQRTPAASRRQLIYNTTVMLSCQHFFKSFLETFEAVFFTCRLWLSALANDQSLYAHSFLLSTLILCFFVSFFLRVFFLLITYFNSTIVLTFNKSNLFWSSCISNANIGFHLIYINLKLVFIIALSIAIRV